MSEGWVTLIMGFMDMLVAFVKTILAPLSALLGAWGGAFWADRRERRREEEKQHRESVYLSVLVLGHLDQLIRRCLKIALDDGCHSAEECDYYKTRVSDPEFSPLSLNVNWKVLPDDLLFSTLDIPRQIDEIKNTVSSIYNTDDDPCEYNTICTRGYEYAQLGLRIFDLANKIRSHVGQPIKNTTEDKDRLDSQLEWLLKRKPDDGTMLDWKYVAP